MQIAIRLFAAGNQAPCKGEDEISIGLVKEACDKICRPKKFQNQQLPLRLEDAMDFFERRFSIVKIPKTKTAKDDVKLSGGKGHVQAIRADGMEAMLQGPFGAVGPYFGHPMFQHLLGKIEGPDFSPGKPL